MSGEQEGGEAVRAVDGQGRAVHDDVLPVVSGVALRNRDGGGERRGEEERRRTHHSPPPKERQRGAGKATCQSSAGHGQPALFFGGHKSARVSRGVVAGREADGKGEFAVPALPVDGVLVPKLRLRTRVSPKLCFVSCSDISGEVHPLWNGDIT